MNRLKPAGAPRGRPKDAGKRAAILAAAKTLFARRGLDGVSMDAVARRARVSKLTLYSHFRSKEDLFQQAVEAKCQEHTPPALFDVRAPLPLRDRLRRIGRGFVELLMSAEAMELHRLMASQGGRRPSALGRLFFEAGPEQVLAHFSGMLDAAVARGELAITDTDVAAGHFFCLLKGTHHFRVLVGARATVSQRVLNQHVDDVVAVFLRAYRVS